jgi:hypothetical protein
LHKAPCGGEGTGKNPTDRAKLAWKWSIATDAHGIPIGWAIDGANRNDVKLLDPTHDMASAGLLEEIETLHLDRGYDYPKVRAQLAGRGLDDLNIQLRRNTDRRTRHRHAQLCLVVALLITAKLIDWRNRWSPDSRPIR